MSIACGAAVQKAHGHGLRGKILTVENGVSFNWPVRNEEIASMAKKVRGFDNRFLHFLIIGSMIGWNLNTSPKGYDVLIDAWRRGNLGDRACVLHILGDGTLRGKLTTLAGGDNSIIFHGVQPNVSEWLLAADCYVMPSRYEGLPIAGIEAAGTGLPCIFTDIGPLRELKPPQALWVPSNNAEALTQALLQVQTERPRVDVAEVNQFRNRFDIKQTAKTYGELYGSHKESKVA
jgi:glycosyltransferase involved in cell wall biosynthesis